jgi:hypothetical protein
VNLDQNSRYVYVGRKEMKEWPAIERIFKVEDRKHQIDGIL